MTRTGPAIATMTLARDAAEERILHESLAALDAHGIPMSVADGGSSDAFVAALGALPRMRLVAADAPGLVGQIGASLRDAAAAGDRVLYTEPDKRDFFDHHLSRFLRSAPDDPDVGVVIAARSARALATFPPMQRATESAINAVFGELAAQAGDYCYGPFIARSPLVGSVGTLDRTLGWGWRFAVFDAARRAGARIVMVEGDYECPPYQRAESAHDRRYRILQLQQNVHGVIDGERA